MHAGGAERAVHLRERGAVEVAADYLTVLVKLDRDAPERPGLRAHEAEQLVEADGLIAEEDVHVPLLVAAGLHMIELRRLAVRRQRDAGGLREQGSGEKKEEGEGDAFHGRQCNAGMTGIT